jgi:hypothetical protein
MRRGIGMNECDDSPEPIGARKVEMGARALQPDGQWARTVVHGAPLPGWWRRPEKADRPAEHGQWAGVARPKAN